MKNLVHSLRQKGYQVKINHYRHNAVKLTGIANLPLTQLVTVAQPLFDARAAQASGAPIWPCGGATAVEIQTPDGKTLTGRADCSLNDNFCKRRGVLIAINRALSTTV